MLNLPRLRQIILCVVALPILPLVYFLPLSGIDLRWQVAIEAIRVVLGVTLLLAWLGWTFSPLLLPDQWKKHEMLLLPVLGLAIFMPAAYFLNYFVDMRVATILIAVLSIPLGLRRFLHCKPQLPPFEGSWLLAGCALGLLVLAFIPHVVQGSMGLLAYNGDEEGYFDLASYFLVYPAGSSTPGPAGPVFGHLSIDYRAEGWGYYYLMAMASAVSGVAPFSTYLAASYLLLCISVFNWYLFFRETLGLSSRWAKISVILYAINGLPLWFAAFGFGRQIAWLAVLPVMLSAFSSLVRQGGMKSIVFAGVILSSYLMTETRLAVTHFATVLAGLTIYWFVVDRRFEWIVRLGSAVLLAMFIASPVLWYFTQAYLVQGSASSLLSNDSSGIVVGGPNMTRFFPLQEVLGLDATDLAKMREPIPQLSSFEWLDAGLGALAPYFAYLLLSVAIIGMVIAAINNPLVLALTVGYFAWIAFTALVIHFPYGYFKLFAAGIPLILGYATLATSKFWQLTQSTIGTATRWRRFAIGFACVAIAVLMARNTSYSVLFGARGWGLSIPPDIVRGISELGHATKLGSRVYLSGFAEYPVPNDRYVLRKEHRLAMQSEEETRIAWARRIRAQVTSSLIGREIFGVFNTRVWDWSSIRPGDDYDYYILEDDEDPRIRGLDPENAVLSVDKLTLYRSPGGARASSEQILSSRGTLRVDAQKPLVFSVGARELAINVDSVEQLGSGVGRFRLALLTVAQNRIEVFAGGFHRSLLLDPGLSWYTSPDLSLPVRVQVVAASSEPVRVVAIQALPNGPEGLDRCNEAILSAETKSAPDAVEIELWYSNPMRDAKGAKASIDVLGKKSVEQDLALAVPEKGDRWLLRFPLKGGGPLQFHDGHEVVPMEPVPWLEDGGGILVFRFKLGRERPREYPLAKAIVDGESLSRLDRYVDPVQLRLWGYYHRYERAQTPDVSALEGTLVSSGQGQTYIIKDGRRCWVENPASIGDTTNIKTFTPDELWLIPPGLPINIHDENFRAVTFIIMS